MKKLDKSLLKENIEKRMKLDFEQANVSGVAVKVCQNNETVYENYFGTTRPTGVDKVKNDTLFRLASMTKPITAVAVMILYDRGLLKIEDLIEDYLPEFKNVGVSTPDGIVAPKVKPSILHLLTHTSGIGSGAEGEKALSRMTAEDKLNLENAMKYYSENLSMSFEPFSATEYSAFVAFDILARIVEIITGEDYNEFLKREIFIPCEMNDTTFVPNESQWKRLMTLHNKIDGKAVDENGSDGCTFGDFPTSHYLGGAGIVSTLNDYSNFAQMLVNNGVYKNNRVLSEKAVKLMSTVHVPESVQQGNQRWGLGVRVIANDSYKRLPTDSYGWSGAYGTHFWVDPTNKITAVYMKNSIYDGGAGAVTANNFEEDVNNSFEDI